MSRLLTAGVAALALLAPVAATNSGPQGIGCTISLNCQINRDVSQGQLGPNWDDSHVTPNATPENANHDTSNPSNYRIHWYWANSGAFNSSDEGIAQFGSWSGLGNFYEPTIYYRCYSMEGTNKVNITFGTGGIGAPASRQYRNVVGLCNGAIHTINPSVWGYPLQPVVTRNNKPLDNHPFVRWEVQKGGVDSANELTISSK